MVLRMQANLPSQGTIVQNHTLYEFTRLVKEPLEKEVDAKLFYCFLCHQENNRLPQTSTQLGRHIKLCTLDASQLKISEGMKE
jgi:hypothetical protein